jgi:phospholipid/cholesterol/gamma-HCH transport system ATP-binding protein
MGESESYGKKDVIIEVRDLKIAYGNFVLMHNLNFSINRGDIFIVMGTSGSGKSTLVKQMIGLKEPAGGRIVYDGVSYWDVDAREQEKIKQRFGVLFQAGALWSSMTLAENVALPLEHYTSLPPHRSANWYPISCLWWGLPVSKSFTPTN